MINMFMVNMTEINIEYAKNYPIRKEKKYSSKTKLANNVSLLRKRKNKPETCIFIIVEQSLKFA